VTNRRTPQRDDGWEPGFAEYLMAREVIVYVRKWLAEQGENVNIMSCPVFSHIVLNSSPLANPEMFAVSQLGSVEGHYDSGDDWHAGKVRREGDR